MSKKDFKITRLDLDWDWHQMDNRLLKNSLWPLIALLVVIPVLNNWDQIGLKFYMSLASNYCYAVAIFYAATSIEKSKAFNHKYKYKDKESYAAEYERFQHCEEDGNTFKLKNETSYIKSVDSYTEFASCQVYKRNAFMLDISNLDNKNVTIKGHNEIREMMNEGWVVD